MYSKAVSVLPVYAQDVCCLIIRDIRILIMSFGYRIALKRFCRKSSASASCGQRKAKPQCVATHDCVSTCGAVQLHMQHLARRLVLDCALGGNCHR